MKGILARGCHYSIGGQRINFLSYMTLISLTTYTPRRGWAHCCHYLSYMPWSDLSRICGRSRIPLLSPAVSKPKSIELETSAWEWGVHNPLHVCIPAGWAAG